MAFAAPLAAFSASQDNEEAFPLVFRLGHDPAVPLLRGVLSHQSAAGRSAGGRLRHSVVARGQPVPESDARPGRRPERRPSTSLYLVDADRGRAVRCLPVVPGSVAHVTSRTLALRVLPPGVFGLGRGRRLIERDLLVARRTWWIFAVRHRRAGLLSAVDRHRHRQAGRGHPGSPRHHHPLRQLRGAGPAGRLGDERGGVREHLQRLFQAQVRQGLRRRAGHAAACVGRRPGRDRLRLDPRARSTPRCSW